LMVYVPGVAALDGKKLSPEPETNEIEKFAFWLVPVASTTFHVAPWVISPPGDAVALKNTGVPFLATDWLAGETVMDETPERTTETEVDPVHALHPPDEAVMVEVPD
jgi:hypothetical protein